MAQAPNPTVVLVHGAWADASSWRAVIARLLRAQLNVVAVQNPTTSLADDVAATRRTLQAIDGPVVLVGHSWGGTVITEAGKDPKVRALVYVAAFAPDTGESTGDQVGQHPPPPGLGGVVPFGDGFLKMGEASWIANVAQDLPEEEARTLAVVQTPLALTTFNDRIGHPAWRDRSNWYVVSSQDRAVSVDLQRALATRLQARTTELPASHMSLLSMPDAVAEVIAQAVAAVSSQDA
ncbi:MULTISPECIES: alpha/beta hydrolase [Pseudoxanthomonas]|uniref:Pimeloyl-ACP methyl ester carboxylesterase n=1 Tax=Pseudoxanthomonas winnipegensis TaxID=2480810 RepID=A0AAW8G6V1_9GAMM|nr:MULTISPECIES: alpha/beta hydrolase [Pseudoxanthomonas]MDQ1118026.1 pimeloyl-ACP methyl ester carboxylesterase [Pseudoxanthomonas winnipegensis]MDQ1134996.1 pimeloyl-ACP methyl ester carboxylesterase [Pseudoxanthomonas winnipegensis]MDR6138771.1 pimeloyl-ACP methyl ester carboxylesterase [Pseudoxanthomonas sp. SORGH_AS_0997]